MLLLVFRIWVDGVDPLKPLMSRNPAADAQLANWFYWTGRELRREEEDELMAARGPELLFNPSANAPRCIATGPIRDVIVNACQTSLSAANHPHLRQKDRWSPN